MDQNKKLELVKAVFEYLLQDAGESFLDSYPDFSRRLLYEIRDEVIEAVKSSILEQEPEKERVISLYIDGASQPQKKTAGIGGIIFLNDSEIESFCDNIGTATNNEAEYNALIRGLEVVRKYRPHKVFIFADSELVVKQINGEYRVRNSRIQKLYGKAMNLLHEYDYWNIDHIPREKNTRADKLSKQALLQKSDSR